MNCLAVALGGGQASAVRAECVFQAAGMSLCERLSALSSFFHRNQVMRKKLILFFKRRNHARKQRVSVCVCARVCSLSDDTMAACLRLPLSSILKSMVARVRFFFFFLKAQVDVHLNSSVMKSVMGETSLTYSEEWSTSRNRLCLPLI